MAGIVSAANLEVDTLGPPNAVVSQVVLEVDDNSSITRVSQVTLEVDVANIPPQRRPVTPEERDLMRAQERAYFLRVEVENGSGTLKDLTNLDGVDWVDSARWGEHLDQPTGYATITLKREASDKSLSPFMASSTLNRLDDGLTYSPAIDVTRMVHIWTAVMPARSARPANNHAAWKEVFRGKIDRVNWESDPITLSCRDMGAFLLDAFIELERQYGAEAGAPVEQEMQQIIDDTMGVGEYTLVTPLSPGWMIRPYAQAQTHVLEAIRALALQIGWDLRFMWNATNDFELRFFAPPRDKTDPDDEFGPDEYFDVSNLSVSDDDVRNVVKVVYVDKETQTIQSVTLEDPVSIVKYKRRYMEIVEGSASNIDTSEEATSMASAGLSDLALPGADHSIDVSYYWPATLGDLYRHLSNDVHYDDPQTYAVVAFEHVAEAGDIRTTLITRGKPAGAYRSWFNLEASPSTPGAPPDIEPTLPPPVPLIQEVATADPINNVTVQYTVTRPSGFNGALDYRRVILNDPDGQSGDDSGWLAFPETGLQETIERGVGRTRFIRFQARWTANPETSAMAEYVISPKRATTIIGDYDVQRAGAITETADSNWETGGFATAGANSITQSWSEVYGVVNNLSNGGVVGPFSAALNKRYKIRAKMRVVGSGSTAVGNWGEGLVYVYASVNGATPHVLVGTIAGTTPIIGNRDSGIVQFSAEVAVPDADPGDTLTIRLAPACIAYGPSGYTVQCTVYVDDATAANREVRWYYATAGTTFPRRGVLFGAEVDEPAFSIQPHMPGDEPTRLLVAEGEGFWSEHGLVLSDEHDLWTQKRRVEKEINPDQVINSTSFVDTELEFDVYAGETLCIEADLSFTATSGNGGVRIRLAGTATYSAIEQQVLGAEGGTNGTQSEYFTTGAPSNGYVNYAGTGFVKGRFYIEVLTDGVARIQAQIITGGNSYLLKRGSVAKMRRAA